MNLQQHLRARQAQSRLDIRQHKIALARWRALRAQGKVPQRRRPQPGVGWLGQSKPPTTENP